MKKIRHRKPRIELRPDDDGLLDDVVVNGVSLFRLEGENDGNRVDFWFSWSRKDGLTATCTDAPTNLGNIEMTDNGMMDKAK